MIHRHDRKIIWTIGHSTLPVEVFIDLLKKFDIKILADIRSYPGSGHYPQFNKENLVRSLRDAGIRYVHLEKLGGRRNVKKDSVNTAWRHPAFRGYADYMETGDFRTAAEELEKLGSSDHVAYMCAEALWWRCHRSMVSDYLKVKGWKVMHILSNGKTEEHPFTQPARIKNGKLDYTGTGDLLRIESES